MSHTPAVCHHNWSAATTEPVTNAAGDKSFQFVRRCYDCGLVDVHAGAIVEPSELRYARTQTPGDSPDD